jgi:hypothetical protein
MPYIGKSPTQAVRQKYQYTATASQTTFSGSDANSLTLAYTDENYIDVTQNGVMLKGGGNDYTATTGTSVVLTTGATADDVIEIIVYDVFAVANHVKKDGDNMTGALTITTDDNLSTLTLTSTDADANQGPTLDFFRNSASPAANDTTGKITFTMQNDAGESITYGFIDSQIATVTDGSEQARIRMITRTAGSLINRFQIEGNETVVNDGSANVDFRVESNNDQNMIFVDGSADKLGIGTSSPSTELHLSTSTQGDIVTFESTDAGAATGPNLLLYRNSSSPADDDNIGAIRFRGRNDNSENVDYAEIESFIVDASDGTEDGTLAFRTVSGGTSTEQMRITSSGFVGIGEASPLSRLHVADGNVLFENTTTNVNSTVHHYTNSVSGGAYRVRFDSNDTVVGSIGVGTSSTAFNTSSDYRLKENVVTDWDATTRLKQLKPSRFNFIADADTTVDGFLAHEVSDIVPEAITGTKDAVDEDGNIDPQSIDQSKLVPLLTKALQEAVAKVETLEARLTALEGN